MARRRRARRGVALLGAGAAALCGVGAGVLGPAPAVAWARQDGEDDPEGDGAPPGRPAPEPDEEAARAADAALRERLSKLRGEVSVERGLATLFYPFSEGYEVDDFQHQGFDKVELRNVQGQAQGGVALELGAGARPGRLLHGVSFVGQLEVELECWVAHNTPSASLCFLLSEKVGVLWGQALVRPSNLRPHGKQPAPDVTLFARERSFRCKLEVASGVAKVTVNGRQATEQAFKKDELERLRFGVLAQNMRLVLTDLRLRGRVDPGK